MELELWLAFAAASLLIAVIPGPGVVSIVGFAVSSGTRTALASVAGMAVGNATAMTLSLAGVGALLAASATAFTILKLAGGGSPESTSLCHVSLFLVLMQGKTPFLTARATLRLRMSGSFLLFPAPNSLLLKNSELIQPFQGSSFGEQGTPAPESGTAAASSDHPVTAHMSLRSAMRQWLPFQRQRLNVGNGWNADRLL